MFRWLQINGPPVREVLKNERIAKLCVAGWLVVSLYIWILMAKMDFNLVFNVIIFSPVIFALVRVLERQVFRKSFAKQYISNRLIIGVFSVAVTTSFFYSALISGDWFKEYKIPSACFGSFHLHHWVWSAIYLIWLAYIIFASKVEEDLFKHSRRAFYVSGLLVFLLFVFVIFQGWFPSTTGFWRLLVFLILFTISLGVVLRFSERKSYWFRIFMAISFGTALGIWFEGSLGVFRNFASTFTYFSDTVRCG